MEDNTNYFKTNKSSWNNRVAVHAKSAMYDLEGFKNGISSLNNFELEALGDVKGKSLLHLQCHFGQDTLSFSRLGAKCVGIDLSDEGITLAKALNDELKLDASFVACNVYDVSEHIQDQFDIVFTSYGVIGWLPDLQPWADMIAARLKPGGVFYIAEFHPIVWMFDYLESTPVMKYAYNRKEVIYEEYKGTYADMESDIICKEYCWNHGLGDVVTALAKAGLHIEFVNEHDESPYNVLPELQQTEDGLYVSKDKLFPLIFEIKATKL